MSKERQKEKKRKRKSKSKSKCFLSNCFFVSFSFVRLSLYLSCDLGKLLAIRTCKFFIRIQKGANYIAKYEKVTNNLRHFKKITIAKFI